MKPLKEFGERVLFVIGGFVALGIGLVMIIYSFSSDANDRGDDSGLGLKIGFVAAVIGGGCIFIGFTTKNKFESIISDDTVPPKKDEPIPPQQQEKNPPLLNEEREPPPLL